ncbi:conjugative transposon protein TraM [Mucilaginibacter sabulilitoris]|uniref:Conjugative transposon protein TraM n=1 Tax=Mucilaginibacter sabulilitoris TaxID=1173583 RepID=A0ABZ0TRM3_9SPHI|nr:conjugative transposon protein TraM [Mucilaginibacter sabulilitoris]WPU95775.1 conjugative transposon protein TraM [Mucilaginibacter sabulilitoris]
MTISFKKNKYIIPIISLPFLCIFFYVYKSSLGRPKTEVPAVDSLQTAVAGVSSEVSARPLSDKLDALRQKYGQSDGYTALNDIQEQPVVRPDLDSSYNDREKKMLDSIRRAVDWKYKNDPLKTRSGPGGFPNISVPQAYQRQDEALAVALASINRSPVHGDGPPRTRQATDPMQLFRQQMALVDSMGKAADTQARGEPGSLKATHKDPQMATVGEKPLPVVKASAASPVFNTVVAAQQECLITAIVDQDITGYAGSRLRVRLLEDMMAGRFLIRHGTYLYAQVTGFSGQRVTLSITTIMQGSHILPVKLEVYDNDGLPGLYVPASAFREFTKELGGDAGNVNLQQQAENNSQLVMSVVQKMFQSTTTAVNKLIRQNKAKLKYNTQVYLVDPADLRNE